MVLLLLKVQIKWKSSTILYSRISSVLSTDFVKSKVYLDAFLWVYFVYIYGSYILQVDTFVRLHDKNSRSGPRFEKKKLLENKRILKQI